MLPLTILVGHGPHGGHDTDFVLGFFLALCAGLATALGAFLIPAIKFGEKKVTAASLGFAAGVMIYVSFVDVRGEEAVEFFENHFSESGHDHCHDHCHESDLRPRAFIALFFFAGIALALIMDWCTGPCPAHNHGHGHCHGHQHADASSSARSVELLAAEATEGAAGSVVSGSNAAAAADTANLARVSYVAFLALTLHNFPEGLATFFAGSGDSKGKWAIPFAIALHNIPEGTAIAVPYYQVTGKFWSAFLRATLAGLAQPVGALFGLILVYALKLDNIPDFLYGAMYSMTAGIMVAVSLVELIPEALENASPFFVGCSIVSGFLLMEVSIICLGLSGAGH